MNAKQIAGCVLLLGALIACISSMATLGWKVFTVNDNTNVYVGVKTWSATTTNGDDVSTQTGSLTASDCPLAACGDLNTGGNSVIATGTVALCLMIAAAVLYYMYNQRNMGAGALGGSIFCLFAAAGLIVLGMVLYSKAIHLGYSFTVFLLGGMLYLTATVTLIVGEIGDAAAAGTKRACAAFLTVCATVVVCIALATVVWFYANPTDDCESDFGVKTWRYVCSTYTVTYSSFNDGGLSDDTISRLTTSGNYAIAFGTLGLVSGVVAVVMIGLTLAGKAGQFPMLAILFDLFASFFVVLGNCLYAREWYVGYSFMVWIASAFFVLLSMSLMVAGVFLDPNEAGTLKTTAAQSSSKTDHHTRLRDAEVPSA